MDLNDLSVFVVVWTLESFVCGVGFMEISEVETGHGTGADQPGEFFSGE